MIRKSISLIAACMAMTCLSNAVHAAASIISSNQGGQAFNGKQYANFDSLPLGAAPGTSGGIGVSFIPDGQAVTGAVSGQYAAPFLSGSNNVNFGNPLASGVDSTTYLTTGVGQVVLNFSSSYSYFGILWGSIDNYNFLDFYNGNTLVDTLSGSDVIANPNGDQGTTGTRYVNILTSGVYNKVVARSSSYAFEFDNVAFGSSADNISEVPEPASLAMWGMGALGMAFARRKRQQALTV